MPDNTRLKAAMAWQAANKDKINNDVKSSAAGRISDAINRAANKYKWTGPDKKVVGDYKQGS